MSAPRRRPAVPSESGRRRLQIGKLRSQREDLRPVFGIKITEQPAHIGTGQGKRFATGIWPTRCGARELAFDRIARALSRILLKLRVMAGSFLSLCSSANRVVLLA